jgi:hypothetical protein
MRRLVHTTVAAIAAITLAASVGISPAHAQATSADFKQVQLSEKSVQGFIAAQKDLAAMASKLQAAGDKPDAQLQAELESVATKNGFTNFADLDDTAANISMVMAGLDPQSGEYVDPVEAIKKEMEEIKKDDKIPEKDKKQMLDEMEQALKTTPPLQFKDNVTIVKKFQKEIEKALQ